MPLAPGMKDKLIHRDDVDLSNRKANEYNIRKYILKYFQDMEEIIWLLDTLPSKQVDKLLEDGKAADVAMKLSEKILTKMELPTVRPEFNMTEIKAVRSYDLGEDNIRYKSKDGKEMSLKIFGCSAVCDLTKKEADAIERTLKHIRIIKEALIPARAKASQREFYENIWPKINNDAEKRGVTCHLEWDSVEQSESLDILLRTAAKQEARRKAAEMMRANHPPE